MGEFVFKRVLHPVGQGAFFSEHFYDVNGNTLFNVVYDCGEMRTTKHLDHEIDNTLNITGKPEMINVMFVSHLDFDHISGIDSLVKMGSLTRNSVVVLPLHYPLVLKLVIQSFRDAGGHLFNGAYDGLQSLFDSEVKILGIDDNLSTEPNDPIGIEEVLDGLVHYGRVKSMVPLCYRNLWYYLPFNTILDDDRYIKFQQALAIAQIDSSQLEDINYVQQHLEKLVDIYTHLPRTTNSVTAINVNSLNILSYSAKGLVFNGLWQNYFESSSRWWYRWEADQAIISRFSCLYTGDCVLENHFKKCLDSFLNNIMSRIGMLQVPHHGRSRNYNKAIACRKEILSGFTNFNSTYKASKFVKQIMHDFSVASKPFYQITENFHARWEMYVRFER